MSPTINSLIFDKEAVFVLFFLNKPFDPIISQILIFMMSNFSSHKSPKVWRHMGIMKEQHSKGLIAKN